MRSALVIPSGVMCDAKPASLECESVLERLSRILKKEKAAGLRIHVSSQHRMQRGTILPHCNRVTSVIHDFSWVDSDV